jgi:hypothetical protein
MISINFWLSKKGLSRRKALLWSNGHDLGLSEVNIFILTDEPAMVFKKLHQIIGDQKLQQSMRAAYRELAGDLCDSLAPSPH